MRFVGAKVLRVEDRRILTGRGHFVDDIQLPGMLHASFLRSPFAHARIVSIDVSAARTAPGVVPVYAAADLMTMTTAIPVQMAMGSKVPTFYALATEKVRFVGDPVVMVVA